MPFKIETQNFTFVAGHPNSTDMLNGFERSLFHDKHLRQAFYPIWVGQAYPKPPTSVQQRAFDVALNTFLINDLPSIHLVNLSDDFGWNCRPRVEDTAIIRINHQLLAYFEMKAKILSNDTALYGVSILITIAHELAHAFGLNQRAGLAPRSSGIAGMEDVVPEHGADGSVGRDLNGNVIMAKGGYTWEAHFFGLALAAMLLTVVPEENGAPNWQQVKGLELKAITGTHFPIGNRLVLRLYEGLTSSSARTFPLSKSLDVMQPSLPDSGYRRFRSADHLDSHSPPLSPTHTQPATTSAARSGLDGELALGDVKANYAFDSSGVDEEE